MISDWHHTCKMCSVTATVAEITGIRCTTEVINVVRTAICNLDVGWEPAAVPVPVKAHCPGHLTIRHTRMTTRQPTSRVCTTPPCWWARRSHPFTRSTVKSKPSRTNGTITISVISGVVYLSVSAIKGSVVVTFYGPEYQRKSTNYLKVSTSSDNLN